MLVLLLFDVGVVGAAAADAAETILHTVASRRRMVIMT